jgi:hypothetical protein
MLYSALTRKMTALIEVMAAHEGIDQRCGDRRAQQRQDDLAERP